jgi:DNA primase
VQGFLDEVGLRGWPKTSGSRGMHVNVRIKPRWTFTQVRRAAVALSRAVERRAPTLAS